MSWHRLVCTLLSHRWQLMYKSNNEKSDMTRCIHELSKMKAVCKRCGESRPIVRSGF